MGAVLSAQMSKLYYPKATVAAAIQRSQCRSYEGMFKDLVVAGCESIDQLCARLRRDGRGGLCGAARAWYKNALADSGTWSLSRSQRRRLRDAWLERPGTASDLYRRLGDSYGDAEHVMVVGRWLRGAEVYLRAVHRSRCGAGAPIADLRTLSGHWRNIRGVRELGVSVPSMGHILE